MNINKPTLIIDKKKVCDNIKRMQSKLNASETVFRPHFKTHQLPEIGSLFRNYGIDKITVSSVSMAKMFANAGWNDITIAFPVNIREIDDINSLTENIKINLLVESIESLDFLSRHLINPVGIFIKIDTGYNRTGLVHDDPVIEKIVDYCSKCRQLSLHGFLTHAGHTYSAKGSAEILKIMETCKNILKDLKQKFIIDFPDISISYGDTPSCQIADDFKDLDEIRPGNFVYNDVMQYHIGSCSLDDIAVTVACPVVAKHLSRNEMVIYGGAVHLSKDRITADNDFNLYGYVVSYNDGGWSNPIPGAYLTSISQEHGVIKLPDSYIEEIAIGDIIGILPIHSCLTSNLLLNSYKIINQ